MRGLAWIAMAIPVLLGADGGPAGSLLQRVPAGASAKANPVAGRPDAARAGAKLFARECSGCHGQRGEGMGKAPPLRSHEVADAPAGALFWILRNGSLRRGMPSFAHLPEPERWQIITHVQSLERKQADAQGRRP